MIHVLDLMEPEETVGKWRNGWLRTGLTTVSSGEANSASSSMK